MPSTADYKNRRIEYVEVPERGYYYANVPMGFFESLREGDITPTMFMVVCWVWANAGWKTGTVKMASASRIRQELWPYKKDRPSLAKVQRAVRLLAQCGYIRIPKRYLHDQNYPIHACGYVVGCDEGKIALRPCNIISYKEALRGCEEPSEGGLEEPLRDTCGTSAEDMRDTCGIYADSLSDRTEKQEKIGASREQLTSSGAEGQCLAT